MLKPFLIALNLIALTVIGSAGYQWYQNRQTTEHVHLHAGFIIYVDNIKQDFSDFKYMSYKPCGKPEKLSRADEQLEKAHLHDNVGEVVHVHRAGATWGDLLQNLKFSYDQNQALVAYRGPNKIENILDQEIQNLDSIVIVIGDQGQAQTLQDSAVSIERIQAVESTSELCGISSHGPN